MAWEHREPGKPAGKENERGPAGERWVLVCGREDFCMEARREIGRRRRDICSAAADGVESARKILQGGEAPTVILAEERVLGEGAASPRQRPRAIAAALSLLASYAPVVWIGSAQDAADASVAMQGAPVDFVPRSALCVPAAVSMVERRLRGSAALRATGAFASSQVFPDEPDLEGRDFGEVLRHELNNPLTGILGNAELLLLEVRRGKLELPAHNLQRLETITELAVRMRETVRLLSDRWKAGDGNLSGEKESPLGHPQC